MRTASPCCTAAKWWSRGPRKACSPDRTIRTPVGSSRAEFPAPDGPPRCRSWTLSCPEGPRWRGKTRFEPCRTSRPFSSRSGAQPRPIRVQRTRPSRTSPSCCAKGGSLGIVGGSGCGKTTLARAILGLHALDSGTITLAGREVQNGGRRISGTSGLKPGSFSRIPARP